jgi:hypothetical protein
MTKRIPTFVVYMTVSGYYYSPAAWPTKYADRPSDATLAEYVRGHEAACEPGGVNAHLGPQHVTEARVVRQATGETVASYTAPMFKRVP